MKKAFTIFELIVAMALMVVLLAGSGVVFRMSVEVHRKATATSEISRKLLAIVQQFDQDFENLRKDGEIIMMWLPRYDSDLGRYVRFDRIMFFATGDFHSYGDNPSVQGNTARICYMLAKDGSGMIAPGQNRKDRILARVQHVYTADESLDVFPDLSNIPFAGSAPYSYTEIEENSVEYDTMTMGEWTSQPWSLKRHMIPVVTDVPYDGSDPIIDGGPTVSLDNPDTVHMLFCEGVGGFSIQGWYEAEQRWVPTINPDEDEDGILDDTDFVPAAGASPTTLDLDGVSVLLYPYDGAPDLHGGLWNYKFDGVYPDSDVTEANFNSIPGLGKAFKFTFTLYDSLGVFPEGKTFTHIVYLD